MKTIKFYIMLLVDIIAVYITIYGHAPKNNIIKIIRNLIAKDNSDKWMKLLFVDVTLKAMAMLILFVIVIPMVKDIPNVREQRFLVVEGEVTSSHNQRGSTIYQRVKINDTIIYLYFNDKINEGDLYTIYYLPNSKFGMEAIKKISIVL